ncbi:protein STRICTOSIDINE SYNTHASE-LIKE 7 isoform X1 [Cryptomeria japonica]|uniref:protein STRICTOSIDINE SYNTHASE-LIKE 7 isoform X1 n=1 Tax=Cryptomeria japonica TaxID=3369 RepID=UPI0027DA0205|nr:protein STRICTOSIDINE SYNTHASE-LIKE 7 isoform X1 [Cryptomeria japonica]
MPLNQRQNFVEIKMDLQIQNAVLLVFICLASVAKSQIVLGSFNATTNGLERAEKIGLGLLPSPEDLYFDREKKSFFTGCGDGWIKRVWIDGRDAEEQVEDWNFVGGRPLGVAFGPNQEVIVCELTKGLLNVTKDKVEVLCSEADGFKFKGMDGVDVSKDGTIYFTDATLGLLIKYNPSTKISTVLLTDLDYPNGVAVSAQEDFLIFCETYSLKCPKYWLKGNKSGQVETFAESLPAYPDNVRVDDEGTFWIGLLGTKTEDKDSIVKYLKLRPPLKRV